MAEPTLGSIEKAIQSGFAAIAGDIADIKAELAEFRTETSENFRDIRAELAEIRRDAERLKEKVGNMAGYSKEIDMLMDRVSKLEEHVGISK